VEISIQAGQPYSQLLTGSKAERPWRIIKVAINWPREQLFSRINSRVDAMIAAGLEDEARRLLPLRHLNALNTVGYKEMFAYFDGEMDLPTAIARIAKNTRVYAKKQLTWLARPTVRPTIQLDPQRALQELLSIINSKE
jgi:tRNA dimethylallyltransferase